jgi:hypothetical protein
VVAFTFVEARTGGYSPVDQLAESADGT